jgi:hypothetical protein
MTDTERMSLSRLQERAAQCRQHAGRARSRGVAIEFERLASDYERDAALIEARGFYRDRHSDLMA